MTKYTTLNDALEVLSSTKKYTPVKTNKYDENERVEKIDSFDVTTATSPKSISLLKISCEDFYFLVIDTEQKEVVNLTNEIRCHNIDKYGKDYEKELVMHLYENYKRANQEYTERLLSFTSNGTKETTPEKNIVLTAKKLEVNKLNQELCSWSRYIQNRKNIQTSQEEQEIEQ